MDRYNRVRLGMDTAVVTIEDGKCGGCHMEVSVMYTEGSRRMRWSTVKPAAGYCIKK